MASPDLEPQLGNMSTIFLTADRYDELKPVFDKLAEGASKDSFQGPARDAVRLVRPILRSVWRSVNIRAAAQ